MNNRILVCCDLSDENSFDHIMPIAEKLGESFGSELHVITVVPTYNMPIVGSYFPESHEKEALVETQKLLSEKIDSRNYKGEIKGHIAQGTIYDEIMKASDKLDCDLIVMASNRPELKDYLLGPNAARVVRHSTKSVFVVRPES